MVHTGKLCSAAALAIPSTQEESRLQLGGLLAMSLAKPVPIACCQTQQPRTGFLKNKTRLSTAF